MMTENNKEKFDANKFVERLLNEGAKTPCDDSVDNFNMDEQLPPFYDEELYKRGQQFYYRHIFALLFSKVLGLVTVLAIPSILPILQHTNMSNTAKSAYRRYLSTVFHMSVWYDEEFHPGSRLWESILNVKCMHNSASKKASKNSIGFINQKDMALTQFGFMGYALVRTKAVGIYNVTEEEWKGFVHVWRVVGYILGIEDRFNICRESLDETREICNLLIDKVLREALEKRNKDFDSMARAFFEGMWCMNPVLNYDVYMPYLIRIVQSSQNNNNKATNDGYDSLKFWQKLYFAVLVNTLWTLKFSIFRLYHNYVQRWAVWMMHQCPFLAYYKFGVENSHVDIFPKTQKVQ